MNVSDFVQRLLSQNPQVVRSGDTTYGPSISRISRTPIEYDSSQQVPGRYTPSDGKITINPNLGADPKNVIRHESIHAILDSSKDPNLGSSIPGYAQIAQKLLGAGGEPAHEVPAYMGAAPQSQILGVSDGQRNSYMQQLVGALAKLDPTLGKRLAKISGVSQ